MDNTDAMVDLVDAELLKLSRYNAGDTMVITAGSPPASPAPPTWSACITWAAAPATDAFAPHRTVARIPFEGGAGHGPVRLPNGSWIHRR